MELKFSMMSLIDDNGMYRAEQIGLREAEMSKIKEAISELEA
jgi:hypothetical protein